MQAQILEWYNYYDTANQFRFRKDARSKDTGI